MPVVESSVVVPIPPALAFAVSQTTGAVRLRWDPFIANQHFLDGATAPAKGVRTATRSWHRLDMVSHYVSYNPPTNVGMEMLTGPWFFRVFAGGWRFKADGESSTRAIWRYSFSCRPARLAPFEEWIGTRLLQRDIDRRIAGFARGCADEVVVAAARAALRPPPA